MPIFDGNLPYTNLHELNNDWIIKTVKEVKDKTENIDESVAEAKEYSENAKSAMEDTQGLYNDFNEDLNVWNTEANGIHQQLNQNTSDIAIHTQQIDNIISGSTPDANTELIDIRVSYDGKTYSTAGDSVRAQASSNNALIYNVVDGYYTVPTVAFTNGSLKNDGTINTGQTYYACTPNDIQLDYPVKISVVPSYRYIVMYEEGGTYSSSGWLDYDTYIPANVVFRIQIGRVTETWAPADLTEFSEKVNFTTKDFGNITFNTAQIDKLKNGNELLDASFRRGQINSGNYVNWVYYRICTPDIVRFSYDITLAIEQGFRFTIHTFDSADNFVADLGWLSTIKISAGQGFKVMIARSVDDTNEKANVFDFYTKLYAKTPFKEALEDSLSTTSFISNSILSNGRPHLVAHMGYHQAYPENSVPSFVEAGKKGYWGIESDVQITSDGYYVMCHDITIDRTTNGSGTISQMTLAEIRSYHLTGYNDLKIPTLYEYLTVCKRYGCVPVIEIKSTIPNTSSAYYDLIQNIKDFGYTNNFVLLGSPYSLSNIRAINSDVPFMPVYQSGISSDFDTEYALLAGYTNVGMDWDFLLGLDIDNARTLHNNNMVYGSFTVDTESDVMTAFSLGVDLVTTNTVLPNN